VASGQTTDFRSEAGLRASRDGRSAAALPKPVKRRRGGPLTAAEIEVAISAGRE